MITMLTLLCVAGALVTWPSADAAHRITPVAPTSARQRDGPASALTIAADIDLFAAGVASGLSTAYAAHIVAELADPSTAPTWQSISALLAIGVDARAAWAPAAGIDGLADIARAAQASERSGAQLATSCERIAESLRTSARDAAVAAAERSSVLIALPLTLCFLPAFFILGLAPIVINLAGTMLATTH